MSDDLDSGLRRLFAATAEHPADEAFVSAVTARTSLRRRSGLALGAVLCLLVAALGVALQLVSGLIGALLTGSPFGSVAVLALLLAVFVCVRALAPLAGLTRL